MDPQSNDFRERLLAQQASDPERFAEYRKGVETMLQQVRLERWWVGFAYAFLVILGTVVLGFGAFAFALVSLYLASRQGASLAEFWVPALGSVLCLFGAIVVIRHVRQRKRLGDLLLEIKRLELRILELEERQRAHGQK